MDEAGKSAEASLLRRLDDGIFAVEQAVVVTFLSSMTIMVFLDVVYRRLVAPDSKLARLLALIFGVDSESGVATLNDTVAPILSVIIGVSALAFGFWTAEGRHDGPANMRRAALRTLAAIAGLGGLGYLMVRPSFSSRAFYVLLFSLAAGAYVVKLVRTQATGWVKRLVVVAVTAGLFVPFALRYFPQGYTWSKEVSLMLLLWVGFLGASVCAHEGKHIRMEALGKLVPEKLAPFMRASGFAMAAVFCAFMAVLGWQYTFDPTYGAYFLGGIFEQTGIPDWLAIAAVPVAFGLTAARFTAVAISTLRGGNYGAPISEHEELTGAQHLPLGDIEDRDDQLDDDADDQLDDDADDQFIDDEQSEGGS